MLCLNIFLEVVTVRESQYHCTNVMTVSKVIYLEGAFEIKDMLNFCICASRGCCIFIFSYVSILFGCLTMTGIPQSLTEQQPTVGRDRP
jgi:hypothetical protein